MGGLVEGIGYSFYPATILPEDLPATPEQVDDVVHVDDVIGACVVSDVYDYTSLVEARLPERYLSIKDAPDETILAITTALEAHNSTRKVANSPHLLEVIRDHDKEAYDQHTKKAELLVHVLRELLGDGGIISRQDFHEWGEHYALVPERTDERERFARVFATRKGVYFDEAGQLHIRPLSFKQSLRLAGRVSTAELLDKVEGMPYDAPPIPAPPKPPRPIPKQKVLPETTDQSTELPVVKRPYVSPIEHLRDAEGNLPVPCPPKTETRLLKITELPPAFFKERVEQVKPSLRKLLEEAYRNLPRACVVTDFDMRQRVLRKSSLLNDKNAKTAMREIIAEDERFSSWDDSRKIFIVVKPNAREGARAAMEKIITDQQVLVVQILDAVERLMRDSNRIERYIGTEELMIIATMLDTDVTANRDLIPFLVRNDERITTTKAAKKTNLHFTVPSKDLSAESGENITAPKESEPEITESLSVAKRLSRLALRVCRLPWRRA
jgi:hypothetical protein